MADYCSNKVTFSGINQESALQYFAELSYDFPPFYDILADNTVVYFESRWAPPIKDLNEIAEIYDVSYDLVYQLPNERTKEKFHYACLQDAKLSKHANTLRELINAATGRTELDALENTLHDQAEKALINNHEREILAQLLGKKYVTVAYTERSRQSISPGSSHRIGR